MPEVAWHLPADVKLINPTFNGTVNGTRAAQYRRAYYAAISYQDYNIGVVLTKLDVLGFAGNTTVVVFGDHGWQLGEHDTWAKMTNFELATRTPLFIRRPWKYASIGAVSRAFVELVDLYPTLAALSGLAEPQSIGEAVNGTSIAPLFDAPQGAVVKDAAFSQFGKVNLTSIFNK